jgi:RNA polymerase sigma-70 factor (ECF subfamily)
MLFYQTQDKDLADELAQQTFIKVWLNRKTLNPGKSFLAYINTLSSNLLKDYFRSQKVRLNYANTQPDSDITAPDPEKDFAGKELQLAIRHIVNQKLAPKCRQIFLLSRMDGTSNDDIAAQLHISKKTVENQLYTALKILRRHLKKDFNISFKK